MYDATLSACFTAGCVTCAQEDLLGIVVEYISCVEETYGEQMRTGAIRTVEALPSLVLYQGGVEWARFDFNEVYGIANQCELLTHRCRMHVAREVQHVTLLLLMWEVIIQRLRLAHGDARLHTAWDTRQ